jgi:hypothetical protein
MKRGSRPVGVDSALAREVACGRMLLSITEKLRYRENHCPVALVVQGEIETEHDRFVVTD